MAGKTAKMKTSKAAPKGDAAERIVDAALVLAADKAWRDISLAEIAEAAGLSLADAYDIYPSKGAVLTGFARRIDRAVLAGQEQEDRGGSARDRLFNVIMRRFDALAPAKAGVGSIVCGQARDPVMGLCGLVSLARSMACMLEAAELSASGLRGIVRIKALSAIYLATLRVWLRDESPDLSRTMASLDRHLRRAEWLAARCSQLRHKHDKEAPAAA